MRIAQQITKGIAHIEDRHSAQDYTEVATVLLWRIGSATAFCQRGIRQRLLSSAGHLFQGMIRSGTCDMKRRRIDSAMGVSFYGSVFFNSWLAITGCVLREL